MISELLGEIYWVVVEPMYTALAFVYVTLLVVYLIRLAIKFINDGEQPVNYFFTTDTKGIVRKLTLGTNDDTADGVAAAFYGMIGVPAAYAIAILFWPAILAVLLIYGFLTGARGFVRFKKKVEKHIQTQEEE
jgi:hypothetical protein